MCSLYLVGFVKIDSSRVNPRQKCRRPFCRGICSKRNFSDKRVENPWQGVFDPIDAEREYNQNPTEMLKTVDKGLRPSWRRVRIRAESDKPVEYCWQGLSALLWEITITRTSPTRHWRCFTRYFQPVWRRVQIHASFWQNCWKQL